MSVLGTGFYEECTYIGKHSSTRTRFIQEATLREIGADNWTEEDAAYIFLTQMAKENNWDKSIESRKRPHEDVCVPYSGLERVLSGMNLKCQVVPVYIKDGKDESEMWDIFNAIYSCIEEEDELYFDLTHAFRYIPMLVLVLGSYSRFMNNSRIVSMSYGNYEARNMECGESPMIDLMPLAMLQNWTSAAASFKEMGRVAMLSSALDNELNTTVWNNKADIINFSRIAELLKIYDGQIMTCRGKNLKLGNEAVAIKSMKRTVRRNQQLPLPLKQILGLVIDSLSEYESNSSRNIVVALKWCKRYNLVQQGYTLCQEGIVTWLCERFDSENPYRLDTKNKVKNYRDYWSSILGIDDSKLCDEISWRKGLAEYRDLTHRIVAQNWLGEIRRRYQSLTKNRNTINHGGFTSNQTEQDLIGDFDAVIDNCLPLYEEILNLPDLPEYLHHLVQEMSSVFINYSNHPSSAWGEKQLAAARVYGEVVDLPFHIVGEDYDENKLSEIAEEETAKILALAAGKNATVHIMGEMTLTFAVVARLKASGVRCVASTTARQVTENADGTRTCTFNFVRFRAYE